jgi:hypothetical protein
VRVRLSVCGGAGRIRAVAWERRLARHKTIAERFLIRSLPARTAACGAFRLHWPLTPSFAGRGRHTVTVHVRDSLGRLSNGVLHLYRPLVRQRTLR